MAFVSLILDFASTTNGSSSHIDRARRSPSSFVSLVPEFAAETCQKRQPSIERNTSASDLDAQRGRKSQRVAKLGTSEEAASAPSSGDNKFDGQELQ